MTTIEFQQQVPISTYDDYREAIAQIAAGTTRVLTRQKVRMLEPTSGSTSGEKLIPYTAELQRQFQRSIDAWIHNLMTCRPKVRSGRAYWSISPCLGPPRTTPSGIPIGFDDDVAYLSRWEQLAVRRLLAVPPAVAKLPHMDNFRYATLLHLLRASDLTLISIWSPTFSDRVVRIAGPMDRATLLRPAARHHHLAGRPCWNVSISCRRARCCRRPGLESGGQEPSRRFGGGMGQLPIDGGILCTHLASLAADQLLAGRGGCAIRSPTRTALSRASRSNPKDCWPRKPVCPCHCAIAPARRSPSDPISSSLSQCDTLTSSTACPAPARTASCLAHELELGRRYRVVVTTGGGLYRYQLGDLIEVVGFENQCPLIRFLGRADRVADLVGEKIDEAHVRDVLQRAFSACQMDPDFAMLVPRSKPPGYQLLLQLAPSSDAESVERLRRRVESGLTENPYYRHAIGIKQLAALVVTLLEPSTSGYWKKYEDLLPRAGQKAGDIKPTVLAPADWTEHN